VGGMIQAALLKDQAYAGLFARQYNILTVGNELKWVNVHPEPDRYEFKHGDAVVAFGLANRMAVRGHVLVWENQLPDWLTQGKFTRLELMDILCRHIKTVVGRYRGSIYTWDVVNEAFDADGSMRPNLWLRTIGPEYIAMAFQWAHEADPQALLIYNDFAGEGLSQKSEAIYALVQGLLQMGMPLHGIGVQMHVWLDGPPTAQELAANMRRLAELGLQVQITEMDVRTQYSALSQAEKLISQAQVYRSAMETCLDAPNCKVFITWGLVDGRSWINSTYGADMPLLFDDDLQPKPAYYAIQEALKEP